MRSENPFEERPDIPPLVGGIQQNALNVVFLLNLLLLSRYLYKNQRLQVASAPLRIYRSLTEPPKAIHGE